MVRNTITLESDPLYYQYWIHIGRGSAKEALDIARSIEDRDLIVFALLKYREEIKADERLSGDEKQQEIKEIQSEIDEYIDKKEEQERELQKEQNNSENTKEEQLNNELQAPVQPSQENSSNEASSAQPAGGQGTTESTPN